MLRRLRERLDVLRPRSLARMRKSLDDVAEGIRELRRAAKERTRLAARVEEMNTRLRELGEKVESLTLRESQLRAVAAADAFFEEDMQRLSAVCDGPHILPHLREAVRHSRLNSDPLPYLV